MQIETYEIEEIQGELGTMAADSESIELIDKLGLSGQKELCDKDTDTRFPYPVMSEKEALVYGVLFPEKTAVENYKSGIIPLRVLQVVAHVKQFDFIKRIEVWHPADARDKDPVLVAISKHPQYDWSSGPTYILARWGDALKTIDELSVKARKIWAAKTRADLTDIQGRVASELASLDAAAESAFLTGKAKTYSFQVS